MAVIFAVTMTTTSFQLESLSYQTEVVEAVKSATYEAGFKKISGITIERIQRAIQGYGDNPQPIEAGFKVFTLDKCALSHTDFATDPEADEAAQAVRAELLLNCGFELDVQLMPITEVRVNQIYHARDRQTPPREAIVCFDSYFANDTLELLRQQKGQCVIVLEAALVTTEKWHFRHQLGDGLVVF